MAFILSNWYVILGILAVICLVIAGVVLFFNLPTTTQIAALKEWLKYAVTLGEKELGSGTGQLKLRMVYDMFVEKFAWLASYISFDKFSGYVDEALEWLENQLSSNEAVATLVNGDSSEQEDEEEE